MSISIGTLLICDVDQSRITNARLKLCAGNDAADSYGYFWDEQPFDSQFAERSDSFVTYMVARKRSR